MKINLNGQNYSSCMRKFASIYQNFLFVQQVAAQIPWWHKENYKKQDFISKNPSKV